MSFRRKVVVPKPSFVVEFQGGYGSNEKKINTKTYEHISEISVETGNSTGQTLKFYDQTKTRNEYVYEVTGYPHNIRLGDQLISKIDSICPAAKNIGITLEKKRQLRFIVPIQVYKTPTRSEIKTDERLHSYKKTIDLYVKRMEEKEKNQFVKALMRIHEDELKKITKSLDRSRVTKLLHDLVAVLVNSFINTRVIISQGNTEIKIKICFSGSSVSLRAIDFVCQHPSHQLKIKNVEVNVDERMVEINVMKTRKRTRDEEYDSRKRQKLK